MHLFMIRHGEAEGSERPDEERALTHHGIETVQRMAHYVRHIDERPQRLFVSPLLRARQTADIFAQVWDIGPEIVEWMRPAVTPSEVSEQLKLLFGTNLALVGHMPHLGLLLGTLVWGMPAKEVLFAKAAVAHVTCEECRPGAARLRWLVTPESLDDLNVD